MICSLRRLKLLIAFYRERNFIERTSNCSTGQDERRALGISPSRDACRQCPTARSQIYRLGGTETQLAEKAAAAAASGRVLTVPQETFSNDIKRPLHLHQAGQGLPASLDTCSVKGPVLYKGGQSRPLCSTYVAKDYLGPGNVAQW